MLFFFLFIMAQLSDNQEGKVYSSYYTADSVISHSYNVLHYDMNVEFFSPYDTLSGNCQMTAIALNSIDTIPLHFGSVMNIDSILVNSSAVSYTRVEDTLYIISSHTQNSTFMVHTFYNGKPSNGVFQAYGGFYTDVEGDEASKQWWPCYDYCYDKADSGIDLTVTLPLTLNPVSNGIITSVDTLSGNRHRFDWEHNFSIATYLVALYAAEYVTIERTFNGYPNIYYAIPGASNIALANQMLDSTEIIMGLFDTLIAIYPFATEKLSQTQSSGYNAMENQTCIRYGEWSWDRGDIHAHELAHSWWGDAVTCIDFSQMFINEGTTSYFDCIGTGAIRGESGYRDKLILYRAYGLDYDDYYHWPIINSPNPFGTNVYRKGAWVHHMLRHIMGDSLYFPAMTEFYNTFNGGNASITDLRFTMLNHYQDPDSLIWFFQQWLIDTDYPKLDFVWSYNSDSVFFNFEQIQQVSTIFRIPIELGVWNSGSFTTYGPFWMTDSFQEFSFYKALQPDSITVDPNIKLYFRLNSTTGIDEQPVTIVQPEFDKIMIGYTESGDINMHITSLNRSIVSIYDLTGRRVDFWEVEGNSLVVWKGIDKNGQILPSGRYYAVLENTAIVEELLLIR